MLQEIECFTAWGSVSQVAYDGHTTYRIGTRHGPIGMQARGALDRADDACCTQIYILLSLFTKDDKPSSSFLSPILSLSLGLSLESVLTPTTYLAAEEIAAEAEASEKTLQGKPVSTNTLLNIVSR